MNIFISEGAGARFNPCQQKEIKRMYGGMDNGAYYIWRIINAFPEHTFYYLGSNDFDTMDNLPSNLVNLEQMFVDWLAINNSNAEKINAVIDFIKSTGIHFDRAVLMYNTMISLVDYTKGYLCKKGTPRKILGSEKRHCYVWNVVKEFKIPYYLIEDDTRQANVVPCDMHQPIAIIGQMNGTDVSKYYINLSDKEVRETPYVYASIPTVFLGSFVPKKDWRNKERTNEFVLTLNGNPYRYKYIKKWILNFKPQQPIYGVWDNWGPLVEQIKKDGTEQNFVKKAMKDMEDDMYNTKYTLVVPLDKKFPQFTTLKAWAMAYYGIIPFWCKTEYDSDNLLSMFPDYLKVNSPKEMWDKIDELNHNQQLYNEIQNQLYSIIKDEFFTKQNEVAREVFAKLFE